MDLSASAVPPTAQEQQKSRKQKIRVTTLEQMSDLLGGNAKLFQLDVRGDSYNHLVAREDNHPVVEALKRRREAGTTAGQHKDALKLGLSIEGGGMRGCVSAGMIAAIISFGMMDCFDAVYGSSAGSLIGAYAVAGQPGMPRLGCSVYYDSLTGAGQHFIDTRYLLRAMGLGLLGTISTKRAGWRDLFGSSMGQPVLKLDYLLEDVVERIRPLDWDLFWKKQETQPLHIIASGVYSGRSVLLSAKGGHFSDLRGLTRCMRASMLLPGITGPVVQLPNVEEPLVDSQLYEPIPYLSACRGNCTHVLVLRSRPDGQNVIGKPKLPERMIARRFFKRKNKLPEAYQYMKAGGHKRLYAKDMLLLNKWAKQKEGSQGPYILPVSLKEGLPEIGRLERTREGILDGVRKGFEHAHDILKRAAPDHPLAAMTGWEAALTVFPDDILEHEMDPLLSEMGYTSRPPRVEITNLPPTNL